MYNDAESNSGRFMTQDDGAVVVIGAGAWGTALAWALAKNGRDVKLWARRPDIADGINAARENRQHLPGAALPENLKATADMAKAVELRKLIFFAVPSQFMRGALAELGRVISSRAVLVSATKGIENNSLALPSGVIADTMPPEVSQRSCYLSGPSFARELVAKTPTAATIASLDYDAAKLAQEALSSPFFRLYVHHDVIGVELGGSVKNVIAIAAGISDGLGFGNNTRAALITRGLMEITRLGAAMGADIKTFTGLSGLGDLVLTCAGDLSRNRSVGLRLGKGEILKQILASMNSVAEGVTTTLSVQKLAERHGVDMPIVSEVYKVIHEGKSPRQAVTDLMSRTLKSEFY